MKEHNLVHRLKLKILRQAFVDLFFYFHTAKLDERPTILDSHSVVSKDFIDQKRDEKDVQKV